MSMHRSKIALYLSKPQGVTSRAADLAKAKRVLGWEPRISYREGFKRLLNVISLIRIGRRAHLKRLLMART